MIFSIILLDEEKNFIATQRASFSGTSVDQWRCSVVGATAARTWLVRSRYRLSLYNLAWKLLAKSFCLWARFDTDLREIDHATESQW